MISWEWGENGQLLSADIQDVGAVKRFFFKTWREDEECEFEFPLLWKLYPCFRCSTKAIFQGGIISWRGGWGKGRRERFPHTINDSATAALVTTASFA